MKNESILLDKLAQISTILSDRYREKNDIGVLSGISGIALFQFYYAKFLDQEPAADLGVEMISSVIEKINEGYSFPTFCTGIAGAAWAIELLKEEEFIDIDSDELLAGLDDYLTQATKEMSVKVNFYDFLHGVLGIGFYFFKRYQQTESLELKEFYKQRILEIIITLDETSHKDEYTVKWETDLIKEQGIKGYNLSLSHGMASIVNFLSRLAEYEDFSKEVSDLLKKSIQFMISHQYDDTTCSSLFPSWVHDKMKKNVPARLGWCYGDLGMGCTLWRAGKVLEDDVLKNKSIEILKHSAIRRDPEEARIVDSGLCHGAYGVMHIYQYMYKETNDELFKETATYWMQQALDMAIHKDGPAGYMQWSGGEQEVWRSEINLLEGIAGIGLSIISYLAPFETKWDQCLLIG